MEMASKIATVVTRAMNNNVVINVCLGVSFATLCVRSVNQQKNIEALEAEKDSLVKANKAVKKVMWETKQQLCAEASTAGSSAIVPLSTLKAIYGEAPVSEPGDGAKNDKKSPAPNFVV